MTLVFLKNEGEVKLTPLQIKAILKKASFIRVEMSYSLYKKYLFLLFVISAAVIMKIYLKKKNQLTNIITN